MVVHGGSGAKPDQLVFDLTYSDKHAEREIVGFRNDGVYFDFEGGSVTFGPRTETSQADYLPPILEIPASPQPGLSRSGVTQAKGADGNVSRTEDWKATVVGQEAVTVGGASVNTCLTDGRGSDTLTDKNSFGNFSSDRTTPSSGFHDGSSFLVRRMKPCTGCGWPGTTTNPARVCGG